MPELRDTQTTFTRGELDPRLLGRIDVAAYRNGARRLRNVIVIPQGGARRRPGTVYVDTVPNTLSPVTISGFTWANPNGGTIASLYDGDSTVLFTTTTNISTTDDYVAFELDLGANTTLKFLDLLNVSLTAGASSEEWAIEGKVDGGSYEVIGNTIRQMNTTGRNFRRTPTQPYRYYRLIRNGTTDLTSAKINVGEVAAYTESSTLSAVREFGFVFADDQRYLMVLTDSNLRIYRSTGGAETLQADVFTPFPSADVADVTYAIDNDTLILFHHQYQPRQVQRQGDHDEWFQSFITFSNIPTFDFGAGAENMWSDARGWPRCGAFFQGRLCMGGSTQRPSTFVASVAGSPFDLDNSTTDDEKAIVHTLAPTGEEVPTIRHVTVGPHLTLFTSSGEFYEPRGIDEAITPTTNTFRLSTRAGMDSGRLTPHAIDGAIYFVQREGQSVREFLFNEVEQNHSANPISLLSSHLIRTPVEIAFRRQLSTNETNLLMFCNSDGTIAPFTILRDQEIAAFSLMVTRLVDSWIGVAGVKDDLYCVARRLVNGTNRNYIERFDDTVYVDSAVVGGAAGSPASLAHLEVETVSIQLDRADQPQQTVASAAVTFARASTTSYQVGLPWPDVKAEEDATQAARGVTSALADGETQVWVSLLAAPANTPAGPLHVRRRRTPEVLLDFFETAEAKINGNRVPFRKFGGALLDKPPPLFTGVKRVTGLRRWSRDGAPEITQSAHQPFTLTSVTSDLTTD